jgi:hypothetical protein
MPKQNQPLRLVSFESILFKRSVIRFFSVLTRFFHCSFRAFHADLALAGFTCRFSAAASPRFTASATSFSA